MAQIPYAPFPSVENTGAPPVRVSGEGGSPDAFGASVGRALGGLGHAVSQFADGWVQQEAQTQDYKAQSIITQWHTDRSVALQGAGANLTGDALGFGRSFRDDSVKDINQRFKDAGIAITPKLQVQIDQNMRVFTVQAAQTELSKRQEWYKNDTAEKMNPIFNGILQNPTEEGLKAAQTTAANLIKSSGMPEGEKEALLQKYNDDLKYYYGVGLGKTDPQGTMTALGQTPGGLKAFIGKQESGDRPIGMHNNGTTAAGRYGFTEDTWTATANSERGKAAGLDPNPKARLNDDQQQKAIDVLIANNREALQKAGVPGTDANVALAHMMGVGGAVKLLQADPNAKAADILPSFAAVSGNQSVFYKKGKPGEDGATAEKVPRTVAEVIALKTGGAGGSIRNPVLASLSPEQQLQIAGQAERQFVSDRANAAATEKLQHQEWLNDFYTGLHDGKLGAQDIQIARANGVLSDYGEIVAAENIVASREKANADFNEGMNIVNSGATVDPTAKHNKDAIDAVYDRAASIDPNTARDYGIRLWSQTGIMPGGMQESMRAGLYSGNAAQMAGAMALAAYMQNQYANRGLGSPFMSFGTGKGDLEQAAAFWNHRQAQGFSPQDIANEWRDRQTPEFQAKAEQRTAEAKQWSDQLRDPKNDPTGDILKAVAPGRLYGSTAEVGGAMQSQMLGDFTEFMEMYHTKFGGTVDEAKSFAMEKMKTLYGDFNGTLTKFPPTKTYPEIGGSHQYVIDQATSTIQQFSGRNPEKVYFLPVTSNPNGPTTEQAINGPSPNAGGSYAPYQLYYTFKDEHGQERWDVVNPNADGRQAGWVPDFSVAAGKAMVEQYRQRALEQKGDAPTYSFRGNVMPTGPIPGTTAKAEADFNDRRAALLRSNEGLDRALGGGGMVETPGTVNAPYVVSSGRPVVPKYSSGRGGRQN